MSRRLLCDETARRGRHSDRAGAIRRGGATDSLIGSIQKKFRHCQDTHERLPKCAPRHTFGQNCREGEAGKRRLPERVPNDTRPDANRRTGCPEARPTVKLRDPPRKASKRKPHSPDLNPRPARTPRATSKRIIQRGAMNVNGTQNSALSQV